MAPGTCVIAGCDRTVQGHGWCPTHYSRWRATGDPTKVKQVQMHGATLEERLWARVDRSGGPDACWPWTAKSRHVFGYGILRSGERTDGAHRVAWKVTNGPIPDGMVVAHRCDNPPCCNPAHLFLATQAENLADMTEKGRRRTPDRRGVRNSYSKLTPDKVREIRRLREAGETHRAIGERMGVSRYTVKDVLRGRTWSHVD